MRYTSPRSLFFGIVLLFCAETTFANGRLLDYEFLTTVTKERMDSLLSWAGTPKRLVPVRYDVEVYSVRYLTEWFNGEQIRASGYYLHPKGNAAPMSRVIYNHGSRARKRWEFKFQGEEAIACFFAADGYSVLMPDFVGLREGERRHLYHHSESEALANVNLLRAARDLDADLGVTVNEQLFISGYSQGGHASLATHAYIQNQLPDEFQVTACAPLSGAYDLSGVQAEVMYDQYNSPSYLPYLLYTMQTVYEVLPDSHAYFISPYDTMLPRLFDGVLGLGEIDDFLPDTPAAVIKPQLLTRLQSEPDNVLWTALKENSPMHWTPEAPVLMCYCTGDEEVRYQNALVAKKQMRQLGARRVKTFKSGGKKFSHGACAIFATIQAKMWFDSFRNGSKNGRRGPLWNRFLLRLGRLKFNPEDLQ
ncbi:MAG: lipase family protein [Bacteroidota bacterium]